MPVRSTVTRKGVELVYWTWPGAAPPTLLLHGIGNYGRYWDLFADAITGRLQLVAPDARARREWAPRGGLRARRLRGRRARRPRGGRRPRLALRRWRAPADHERPNARGGSLGRARVHHLPHPRGARHALERPVRGRGAANGPNARRRPAHGARRRPQRATRKATGTR